ncbi:hypothetical protein LJD47_32155, partial [Escherichia coli]|nr:hypothetical protein [Escherichia coli]
MRKLALVAAVAAASFAVPAFAQDMSTQTTDTAAPAPSEGPRAPDGTRAFGIEPYFGVMGGWEQFSRQGAGIPAQPRGYKLDGALVEGVVGVNVPLGPVFVG